MPQVTSYEAIVTVEPSDVLPIVDVSDTTMSPSGTTKKITVSQLAGSGGGGGGSGYALLAGAEFTGYVAPSVVALSYASTITITATAGNDFRVTLAGSPTFAAPVSPTDGQTIQIWLTQPSSGGPYTAAFTGGSTSVKWAGGTAPTLSTGANDVDILQFTTANGGTSWYGTVSGLNFH